MHTLKPRRVTSCFAVLLLSIILPISSCLFAQEDFPEADYEEWDYDFNPDEFLSEQNALVETPDLSAGINNDISLEDYPDCDFEGGVFAEPRVHDYFPTAFPGAETLPAPAKTGIDAYVEELLPPPSRVIAEVADTTLLGANTAAIRARNAEMAGLTPAEKRDFVKENAREYEKDRAVTIFVGGGYGEVSVGNKLPPGDTSVDFYSRGDYDNKATHWRGSRIGAEAMMALDKANASVPVEKVGQHTLQVNNANVTSANPNNTEHKMGGGEGTLVRITPSIYVTASHVIADKNERTSTAFVSIDNKPVDQDDINSPGLLSAQRPYYVKSTDTDMRFANQKTIEIVSRPRDNANSKALEADTAIVAVVANQNKLNPGDSIPIIPVADEVENGRCLVYNRPVTRESSVTGENLTTEPMIRFNHVAPPGNSDADKSADSGAGKDFFATEHDGYPGLSGSGAYVVYNKNLVLEGVLHAGFNYENGKIINDPKDIPVVDVKGNRQAISGYDYTIFSQPDVIRDLLKGLAVTVRTE